MPLSRRRAAVLLLALLAPLAAMAPSTASGGAADTVLRSAVRFVEHGAAAPARVTLRGETRPVLAVASTVDVKDPGPGLPLTLPTEADGAAWLVVLTPRPTVFGEQPAFPPRILPRGPAPNDAEDFLKARFGPPATRSAARQIARVRPIPPPDALDRELGPIVPTADSVLSFATGFEPDTWLPTGTVAKPAAVEFRVTVVDGERATVMHRRRADPRRRARDQRWVPAVVALGAFAGRAIRVRLEVRSDDPAAPPTLPVWADPTLLEPAPAAPNVVLVSFDTLRAKSVSAYGAARDTMPALAAMAADGVLFEHAFTTYTSTLASHMSMFTGRYASEHGLLLIGAALDRSIPTLPERFRAAGYETGAFTENVYLTPDAGFARGVALYTEPVRTSGPHGKAIEQTFRGARQWIAEQAERPFFAFLHTYEVHAPYVPPPRLASLFHAGPPPAGTEGNRLRYEQLVRHADEQLQRLRADLAALGIADRTLLVVTSDHGEEFGEHGGTQHTFTLYDEVLRIPLVMSWPGTLPAVRPQPPVSLVDLAPTILDLIGLPPLPGIAGRSLAPLIHDPATPWDRQVVFADGPRGWGDSTLDLMAGRGPTTKCIHRMSTQATECFDLATDPDEQRPLAPDAGPPEMRTTWTALRERLDGAPGAAAAEDGAPVAPDRIERLRALGYLP